MRGFADSSPDLCPLGGGGGGCNNPLSRLPTDQWRTTPTKPSHATPRVCGQAGDTPIGTHPPHSPPPRPRGSRTPDLLAGSCGTVHVGSKGSTGWRGDWGSGHHSGGAAPGSTQSPTGCRKSWACGSCTSDANALRWYARYYFGCRALLGHGITRGGGGVA